MVESDDSCLKIIDKPNRKFSQYLLSISLNCEFAMCISEFTLKEELEFPIHDYC